MECKKAFRLSGISLFTVATLLSMHPAWSETFEVKITNLTAGQTFTPRIAVTHSAGNAFMLGSPAITQVAAIAEDGDVAPMMALLESDAVAPFITDTVVSPGGLLEPGKTETLMINGNSNDKFTMINMLIPTNDAFIGINAVMLPTEGSLSYRGGVYDAGVETNDELCVNIPGPVCGGTGPSPNDAGEGFIHVHPGIHGIGDLNTAERDWRNPAVMVKITKM